MFSSGLVSSKAWFSPITPVSNKRHDSSVLLRAEIIQMSVYKFLRTALESESSVLASDGTSYAAVFITKVATWIKKCAGPTFNSLLHPAGCLITSTNLQNMTLVPFRAWIWCTHLNCSGSDSQMSTWFQTGITNSSHALHLVLKCVQPLLYTVTFEDNSPRRTGRSWLSTSLKTPKNTWKSNH